MMSEPLKLGGMGEFLLWLVGRRHRFGVRGDSMLPLLKPGDEVLVNLRAYRRSAPQPGDIVVALHPFRPELRLIKRIEAVTSSGYVLKGDNLWESADSRFFGPVGAEAILGQVTCRFA
jgi:nickel-type superoxide dismutase maturation protease